MADRIFPLISPCCRRRLFMGMPLRNTLLMMMLLSMTLCQASRRFRVLLAATPPAISFCTRRQHVDVFSGWYGNGGEVPMGFASPFVRGYSTTALKASSSDLSLHKSESMVLDQVNESVQRVLREYGEEDGQERTNILHVEPRQRQALAVARNVNTRLRALERNGDCKRCWLQQAHCVCEKCPPISNGKLPNVRRLFLLMHHKEVGLAVDTAKMILAAYPNTCRLVVGGIGRDYQDSMAEMMDAMNRKCLVLFPTENARTFQEIQEQRGCKNAIDDNSEQTAVEDKKKLDVTKENDWDLIVIDGTWAQARKLHGRYIPLEEHGGPLRVQLSKEAVATLSTEEPVENSTIVTQDRKPSGHQLRRHPIKWREVSTLEATRLLLGDMARHGADQNFASDSSGYPWDAMAKYQQLADEAAKRQLGPPRLSPQ